MIIQLNTDKNITGTEALEAYVAKKVTTSLDRFSDRITRVEVHLSDQNANKGGADDIQCRLETRIEGLQPIVVTSKSDDKDKALSDALSKMKSTLTSTLEKLQDR